MKDVKRFMKPLFLVVLILFIIFIGRISGLTDYLQKGYVESLVSSFGIFGPIIFILLYITATVFFLPATPMTLLGGFLFGVWLGTLYVIIAATVGATIAFLVARFFGGEFVKNLMKNNFKRLNKYDKKVEQHGFKTMLILRLIPLFPFNGLNFAMGLTRIKIWDYVAASAIGMIPGTFLYIYIGTVLSRLGSEHLFRELIIDPVFYLFVIVFVILLTIPLLYKKFQNHKEVD